MRSSPTRWCGRCSTGWARTARSAPTRTASRSSPRRPGSTPRAISSMIPTNPAPRPCRICASGRRPIRAPYLIRSAELRRLPPVPFPRARSTCCGLPRPARPSCSTAPTGRTRSGTACRARSQEQIIDKKLKFYVIDATAAAREVGLQGPHQHHPADLLLRDLRRAAARGGDRRASSEHRQDLRPQGQRGRRAELRRPSTARWRGCTRSRCRPRRRARSSVRRSCPRPRRTSCAEVTARMMEGLGDDIPVSAMPVDGTFPSGTAASGRSATSPRRCRSGAPDLCIQCGQCGFVCPHSVIRAKYYRRGPTLADAPAGFKSAPVNARGYPGVALHPAVLCRGLHRLRPLRRGLPGAEPVRARRQGDQSRADKADAASRRSVRTSPSSRRCRSTTAPASTSPMCAACSSWSRCSSSPAPARAAARRPI